MKRIITAAVAAALLTGLLAGAVSAGRRWTAAAREFSLSPVPVVEPDGRRWE